jgi:ABC-type uncharacterized transport system substrate-binding protein
MAKKPTNEQTGKAAGSAASKVLSGKAPGGKAAKSAAGSALTQRPTKKGK